MSYYTFSQNNSGGSFDFDEARGLTHFVIIEAVSVDEASDRAESIGIYFDGCESGMDCDCCGDRWYAPYGTGDEEPTVYGKKVRVEPSDARAWMEPGKEICVHPIKGPLEWYGAI